VIVVNKRQHPLTDLFVREIRGVLALAPPSAGGWGIPVVETEAASGDGVEELEAAIGAHRAQLAASGTIDERRRRNLREQVLAIAAANHRRALERRLEGDASFAALVEDVVARRLDPASAARRLEG
jgi:LAO/AO transport system kinase